MAANTELGWYGKLPVAGDFLHRHMPEPLVASWSNWFKLGVTQWQQSHNGCSEAFSRAPVWNFVLPATLGVQKIQIGCLMPSRDRVGRIWPLLATQNVPVPHWSSVQLPFAGEWFHALGAVLQQAVSTQSTILELEQAMDHLAPLPRTGQIVTDHPHQHASLAWEEVSRRFDPLQYTSYWWTNQSDGYPLVKHKHSGNLTAQLFTQLFHPAIAEKSGRRGLYPPMFDQTD